METQLILILAFIIVCFLIFKAFKAIITVAGSLFLLITFAFFLRSQDIINFDVPKDFDLKNFNFSINEKEFYTEDKKVKEDNIEDNKSNHSKNKLSMEKIKEQEMAEEENIKKGDK